MTSAEEARFWAKVEKTDGCWLWTGCLQSEGYGQVRLWGRALYTHRVSYELANGPIPVGLHIDHLCRVRRCLNPAHLEAVTHAENVRRAMASHCKLGHPFSVTLRRFPNGKSHCVECQRIRDARRTAPGRRRLYATYGTLYPTADDVAVTEWLAA